LYVNSFGGGTVHAIALTDAGSNGDPVLFGEVEAGKKGGEPPWGWDPWSEACQGLSNGDACVLIDQPGTCSGSGGGGLWCDAPDPFSAACDGLSSGDACTLAGESGTCDGWGGKVYCDNEAWWGFGGGFGGGLDGIAVDACDNVYVTEFEAGKVFRWTQDGLGPDLVAELPDYWIPNMDFGTGVGGWDATKLWVVTRDGDRVFGIDIGVPGRPLAHR